MPNPIVKLGHKLLSVDIAYDLYQSVVGGKSYRDKLVGAIASTSNVVLDLGCGTAASARQLNPEQKYFGIDVSSKYISKAKKRNIPCLSKKFIVQDLMTFMWNDKFKEFTEGADSLTLALGVLHHLDDSQVRNLLTNLRDLIQPNSTIFTVDPTILQDSSRIAKWFATNDRGKFIRTPSELSKVFKEVGLEADIYAKTKQFRIPLDTVEIFARPA